MKVFVNEKIVDEKKAVVSVFDRGLLYGDGIFETMRAYGGRVFMLDEHIERLYNSAGIIDLNIRPDKKYIKYIIYRLLKVNRLSEAYIRLSVSRARADTLTIRSGRKRVVLFLLHQKPLVRQNRK